MRFDLETHLIRQREFSLKTFGPGPRTKGVCDHIRKELKEIEADPKDIMEWIDVLILAFDGALRAGWEPQKLADDIGYLAFNPDPALSVDLALDDCESGDCDAWIDVVNQALRGCENLGYPREAVWHLMLAKQIKNESRRWPDWRTQPTDKAIEHDRSAE